jgi:hypothetical protein
MRLPQTSHQPYQSFTSAINDGILSEMPLVLRHAASSLLWSHDLIDNRRCEKIKNREDPTYRHWVENIIGEEFQSMVWVWVQMSEILMRFWGSLSNLNFVDTVDLLLPFWLRRYSGQVGWLENTNCVVRCSKCNGKLWRLDIWFAMPTNLIVSLIQVACWYPSIRSLTAKIVLDIC